MPEISPKRRQVQESFNQHVKKIVSGDITDFQMELTSHPAMYHNEHAILYMPEKRTFTYDGYTQAGKKFSLTIED